MGETRSRIAEVVDHLNRYLSGSDELYVSEKHLRNYVAADKVRVRNRESGRLVWVLPETLRENPEDYLPESSPPPYKPPGLLKSNKFPKLKPIKPIRIPKKRNPYVPRRKHQLKKPIPPKDREDWKRLNLLQHFTKN